MKKLVIALTAIAAFTAPALAADMAAKAPLRAPVAAVASWTGLWISGGFGYGLMDIDHSVTSAVAPLFPVFDVGHDNGGRGWLGKIGVGGDYQFAGPMGNWVIGAFADAQWSSIKGNYSFNCPGGCIGPTGFIGQLKNDFSWAVGGRVGLIALPGFLTYFNGGFTQAHFNQVNYFDASPFTAFPGPVLGSQTRNGYFLGGGTEYAISQIPGLFWKSEYRFADYGNRDNNQVCLVTSVNCGAAGVIHSIDRSRTFVQTATTELVYRFNWGGPVVAKY